LITQISIFFLLLSHRIEKEKLWIIVWVMLNGALVNHTQKVNKINARMITVYIFNILNAQVINFFSILIWLTSAFGALLSIFLNSATGTLVKHINKKILYWNNILY
jgi:hypothetical protein